MKTSFLKMSVPVLALGFVLTTHMDTAANMAMTTPASEGQKPSYVPGTGVIERLGPYEKQIADLEEDLEALLADLDYEETISFEQYQQYQSSLDELIQELNILSQEIEADSPIVTKNFEDLLTVQKKLYDIDVK